MNLSFWNDQAAGVYSLLLTREPSPDTPELTDS